MRTILAVIALAVVALPAAAGTIRDPKVPRDFQRSQPCPATGKTSGACPGWVRDHIVPLCKGGRDAVDNIQWQTIEEAKAKDGWECR